MKSLQWIIVLSLGSVFGTAHAAKPRVGVARFTGKKAAKIQRAAKKALKRRRFRVFSGRSLRINGKEAVETSDRFAVASKKRLSAWLDGFVRRESRQWVATITVTNAADGQPIDARTVVAKSLRRLAKKVRRQAIPEMKQVLRECEAPDRFDRAMHARAFRRSSRNSKASSGATLTNDPELDAILAAPGENASEEIEPVVQAPVRPDPAPTRVRTPLIPRSKTRKASKNDGFDGASAPSS